MTVQSLAYLLRVRMREQGLSNSEVANRAGISRQTWYNLLNADIKEARFSTLLNVCKVLNIHPMDLMKVYFAKGDVKFSRGNYE